MSDPMTPDVKDWMKRTDVEPPDANESARQVRARLPGVRQRRRWWPFPVFYRKPETPPTEQSTSTPTTNGHTPTITGRTRCHGSGDGGPATARCSRPDRER